MERFPRGWQAAIALTTIGVVGGAILALADESITGSDLTGTPLVVLGGLVTVLAAQAAQKQSPADR